MPLNSGRLLKRVCFCHFPSSPCHVWSCFLCRVLFSGLTVGILWRFLLQVCHVIAGWRPEVKVRPATCSVATCLPQEFLLAQLWSFWHYHCARQIRAHASSDSSELCMLGISGHTQFSGHVVGPQSFTNMDSGSSHVGGLPSRPREPFTSRSDCNNPYRIVGNPRCANRLHFRGGVCPSAMQTFARTKADGQQLNYIMPKDVPTSSLSHWLIFETIRSWILL